MKIEWTLEDGIGRIILNQPPSNTMTMHFFREFQHLTLAISNNPGLKAIIIQGNGRHYSAGADISELLNNLDEDVMVENYRSLSFLGELGIPVISAIRGVCLGSAFELALFSNFRISSEEAVLGLPESTFNLMPGLGGMHRVAKLAGNAKAIEITLTGKTFPASEAFEMGLVDMVVPKAALLTTASGFARSLHGWVDDRSRSIYIYKFLNQLNASA